MKKGKHRSWPRIAAWAVGMALVAFELIYVAAANTILRTHSLDRWVTGATEGLFLKIDSGWTVWPGRVYLKGVELHFEDYNIQMSVALDEATVDIALWRLPTKTFHLSRVRAAGVRYLFRHKVQSAAGNERRLALYPKIPGYSDPPLFVGPPTPPLTDEQYNLWTIHLEDVDAAATELWFLEYRFTGKAQAKGGFHLVPERDAQTELCTLTLDGALHTGKGKETVASKLKGWLHAQLDRHDPRIVPGAQIFNKISVNTKLHADVPGLEVADLYRSPGGPTLRRGAGGVDARVQLEHGAWMENTTIRYQTQSVRLAQGSWSVAGPLVLVADIDQGGRDALLALTASSSRLRLSEADSPEGIEQPEARAVRLRLGTTANLTQPIEMRSLGARLALEAPELRWLNHLAQDELFTHGSAGAELDLNWSKGQSTGGTVALTTKQARFALADNVIQVSGTADAQLTYDGGAQRGRANRMKARFPLVAVLHDGDWKALPGGFTAEAERLMWQGEPPRRVQGRFSLDAKEVDAFVPFVISSSVLRTLVKALLDLGETHAVVELDRDPSALELRLIEARSGALRVFGTLRSEKNQKDACGRFYVDDPKIGIGVVMHRGETSVKPFVSAIWWRSSPAVTTCGPGFVQRKASSGEQSANEADREAKRLANR